MGSLDHTSPKAWKKIIAAATPYIGAYKARTTSHDTTKPAPKKPSARSKCYETDSDSEQDVQQDPVDSKDSGAESDNESGPE